MEFQELALTELAMHQLRNVRVAVATALAIGLLAACASNSSVNAQPKHSPPTDSIAEASSDPMPLPDGIIVTGVNPKNGDKIYGCDLKFYAITVSVNEEASYGDWKIRVISMGVSNSEEESKYRTRFDFQIPSGYNEFSGFVNYTAVNGIEKAQSLLDILLENTQKDFIALETPDQISGITACLPAEAKDV